MTDTYKRHARSLTSPPEHAAAITPDDQVGLTVVSRALYVGAGGDVTVRMCGGAVVTLANVASGTLLPIRIDRVLASGTTAGSLVGFW